MVTYGLVEDEDMKTKTQQAREALAAYQRGVYSVTENPHMRGQELRDYFHELLLRHAEITDSLTEDAFIEGSLHGALAVLEGRVR